MSEEKSKRGGPRPGAGRPPKELASRARASGWPADKVERRPDSAFARIACHPQALVDGARQVMVLKPLAGQIPPRPTPEDAPAQKRPGHK